MLFEIPLLFEIHPYQNPVTSMRVWFTMSECGFRTWQRLRFWKARTWHPLCYPIAIDNDGHLAPLRVSRNLFTADSELHSALNYIDELRWIPTTNTQGEQTTNMHGEQHYHFGRSAEHMWLLVSIVTRQMSGFSACNTQRWPMRIFALHRSYLRY